MPNRIEEVLQAEQRRAKKVEALVELLRDPDLADFVAKLTGEAAPAIRPARSKAVQLPLPGRSTGIREAIVDAARMLPQPFAVSDIVDFLTRQGFPFTRKSTDATRDALYFMIRDANPGFRVKVRGRAGNPSTYYFKEIEKEATVATS